MKITKFGHCCLLIETKGKRILTDPGAWSDAQNSVMDIDLILITHEHADHLHIESLEQVLALSPAAKIVTNTSVGKILSEKGIVFEVVDDGKSIDFASIAIEGFGTRHQEIFEELGQVENTGYFIDNDLFYPGDALTDPNKPVRVLAFPIAAPWMRFKDGMEYVLRIKPQICFPVHEGFVIPDRTGPTFRLPPMILESQGIQFVPLKAGDSHDF